MSFLQTIRRMLSFILHFFTGIIGNILRIFILFKYQMKDISGEIALVTGAGGGLGRSLALGLANLGVIVVIWDINQEGIEETMKLIKDAGGTCYGYVCDLCNREDIYKAAALLRKEVGKVTILINNAGVVNIRKFWEIPDDLLIRTMNVNIMSHFWTVKAFLPGMMESNKGYIVSIASVAGHIGFPKAVEYCTSKYAVVGFNEALQIELMYEGYNINTTVVCPYFIHSTGIPIDGYSRFLPTFSPKEVAERTITSLRCNKKLILIPAYFQFLLIFKWILPWFFIPIVLRCLIRDISSTYETIKKSSVNGIKTNIITKIQNDGGKHQ
ncbi:short-chain dehydrogenase/reductase family 16C member 6 isoform X1 [Vespula squamosa]|uniref:Short-chain dehydrogenase/reductase 3 n=1 Tax=Vespula squamosa TaxID=30214 RepID=A0ABD2BLN9_VESSQ